MSTDLDRLLTEASPEPPDTPDVDALWSAGRRRRRLRQGGTVLATVAAVALVGVAGAGLQSVGTPTVDPVAAPDAEQAEPEESAPGPREEEPEPAPPREEEPEPAPEPEPEPDPEPEPEPGPEPGAAAMGDPCAAHQGGELVPFIDVVSPVDGQRVEGRIELVGCARVHEGTVRYRLLGPGGGVLADSFTTATAGGPELGEFRETITVDATGALTLEVFWDSPADGTEQDRTTVSINGG